jgi:hypothetical protein
MNDTDKDAQAGTLRARAHRHGIDNAPSPFNWQMMTFL